MGSVLFGIAHDLVTAHVFVEYFTVYHPRVVDSESPVVMALVWGVLATWWVGLIAGGVVGFVNYLRPNPLPPSFIAIRLGAALVAMWIASMSVLGSMYYLLEAGQGGAQRRLIAVGATHGFSYFASALLGIGFAIWVGRVRQGA